MPVMVVNYPELRSAENITLPSKEYFESALGRDRTPKEDLR